MSHKEARRGTKSEAKRAAETEAVAVAGAVSVVDSEADPDSDSVAVTVAEPVPEPVPGPGVQGPYSPDSCAPENRRHAATMGSILSIEYQNAAPRIVEVGKPQAGQLTADG